MSNTAEDQPHSPAGGQRDTDHLQGHWVLARAGKTVLRPGGRELTERMLAAANPRGCRVVELAPGMGATAGRILSLAPASYVAVERDSGAAGRVRKLIAGRGRLVEGDAAATGLEDGQADLVVGEAMLTMQGERAKRAIVAEACRVLAPGGRYAIHELALRPDGLAEEDQLLVRRDLAQAIKVNARPLTVAAWCELLESEGFDVEWFDTTDMALLRPRRLLADEGAAGLLRMLATMAHDGGVRRRILTMRTTFSRHRDTLCAVAIVARRRASSTPDEPSVPAQA